MRPIRMLLGAVLLPLVVSAATLGCPEPVAPHPPWNGDASPPPEVQDGPARSSCEVACAHAKVLDCPEGRDEPRCVAVCAHATEAQLTETRADCAAKATSVEAIRACGSFWKCKAK